MCEKKDYNLRGVPVFTEGQFVKSDIQQVKNPRTFRMLERLMPYNLEVEYKEGIKMAVAD